MYLPYQQRVVDEKASLDEKLSRLLTAFSSPLFDSLEKEEQSRLGHQIRYMEGYSEVLAERIAAFGV